MEQPEKIPDLSETREKIDDLDSQMFRIIAARLALIPDIAKYKKLHNLPRYQPTREEEIIKNRIALAAELGINPDLAEKIQLLIIEESHRIEEGIIVN